MTINPQGTEIDLLANYPRSKRDISKRGAEKTEADREVARRFGREFFDGDRRHGYGGFTYDPRFWSQVVPDFQRRYELGAGSTLLDVGCAKGFMLHDFQEVIEGIRVAGIDVSEYAIENAMSSVASALRVADARELPFPDDSFDLVISINTLHNLERSDLLLALREVERVSRGSSFVTVDAYRNDEEREAMLAWNLTAQTILSVEEWRELFVEAGYTGDFFWFVP